MLWDGWLEVFGQKSILTTLNTTSDGVSVARKIGSAITASRELKSGNVGQGSVRTGSRENMVRSGIVQDAVRRDIWSGCGDEFVVEFGGVRWVRIGGRDKVFWCR